VAYIVFASSVLLQTVPPVSLPWRDKGKQDPGLPNKSAEQVGRTNADARPEGPGPGPTANNCIRTSQVRRLSLALRTTQTATQHMQTHGEEPLNLTKNMMKMNSKHRLSIRS